MNDILKTKGKLKITRYDIVDDYVTHTLIARSIKPVQ